MPAIALANGKSKVLSRTGLGRRCGSPMMTETGLASYDGVVVGPSLDPVVLEGDIVALHPFSGCGPDMNTLDKFSSTVFINNKKVGRIGDEYTSDNIITSGFSTVFVGG